MKDKIAEDFQKMLNDLRAEAHELSMRQDRLRDEMNEKHKWKTFAGREFPVWPDPEMKCSSCHKYFVVELLKSHTPGCLKKVKEVKEAKMLKKLLETVM